MSATLEPGDLEDLRQYIRLQVAAGYSPVPDVVADAVDVFADTTLAPDDLRQAAAQLAEEILSTQLAEQNNWPPITDNDRLDAAFTALNDAGIVSRQHFACCATCGTAEIHDEMAAAAKDGATVRGYTFFHIQDTEYAVEGESLFLSYGSADGSEDAGVAIGREIVATLEEHGLHPSWNGRLANRILLPITWQRRR